MRINALFMTCDRQQCMCRLVSHVAGARERWPGILVRIDFWHCLTSPCTRVPSITIDRVCVYRYCYFSSILREHSIKLKYIIIVQEWRPQIYCSLVQAGRHPDNPNRWLCLICLGIVLLWIHGVVSLGAVQFYIFCCVDKFWCTSI